MRCHIYRRRTLLAQLKADPLPLLVLTIFAKRTQKPLGNSRLSKKKEKIWKPPIFQLLPKAASAVTFSKVETTLVQGPHKS